MITRKELTRISRMTGMKPHQQEKHYIQTLILRSIYSKFSPVFKGGTALMFMRGLNRFSEDLDFTLPGGDTAGEVKGEDILKTVMGDLEYVGIIANHRSFTDNEVSFSFRVGAEGPLFNREIERCYVRVEMSRREKVILTSHSIFIGSLYPDILPFSISLMDTREMMAEKVRAILTRDRARDVYDLGYLAERGDSLDPSLVDAKLKYYDRKFLLKEFEQSIEAKRDIWKAELSPILFGPLPDFGTVKEIVLNNFSRD